MKPHPRIKWEEWQPKWIGSDYGLAHFWATYWLTLAMVCEADGSNWKRRCVVYREYVDHDKSIAEYTRNLASRTPEDEKISDVFYSPERFNRTDPQHTPADQFTEELRKFGLPPATRASNDRIAGATFIYSLLDANELVIMETCPNLIRAIPSLIRGDGVKADLEDVLKANTLEDDCYDGFRYGVVSKLHARSKPAETAMYEHAAKIEDPWARHLYVRKQSQNLIDADAPFVPMNVPRWRASA